MEHRWLTRAAWLNALTHAAASVGMMVLLRRGLPGPGVEAPLAWVTAHRGVWALGWSLWTAAALSLVAVSVIAGLKKWPREQVARRIGGWLAAGVVIAAAGADILGQILLVRAASEAYEDARAIKYGLGMAMSGTVGNTLYALGLIGLTAVWHRQWRPRTRRLGYGAGFLGLVLTPLAIRSSVHPWPVTIVTALLMSCVIAWSVSLALEPDAAVAEADG